MSSLPLYYVSSASLGDPFPACLAVGDLLSPRLCFTRERWSELVKRPEAIGVVSTDVGVIAPSLVDPTRPPVASPI
jgi:hypothetical protein